MIAPRDATDFAGCGDSGSVSTRLVHRIKELSEHAHAWEDAGGVRDADGRTDGGGSADEEEAEEEEAGPDEGKRFTCVKPWLGAILDAEPSRWTPQDVAAANAAPRRSLRLQHVHGYRSYNATGNGDFVDDGHLIFYTASVGIVHSVGRNEQFFYTGHKEDICSMDVHRRRRLVATGAIGSPHGMLCVWSYNVDTRTTEHLACMSGLLPYAVSVVAFSADGTRLTAVGDDDHHTVAVYDWARATPLCTLGTPGRNPLYAVRWFPRNFAARYGGGGGGAGDPSTRHFVSCGWKHLYVWSVAPAGSSGGGGGALQLHRHKAALIPHGDHAKGHFRNASSFASVSFTDAAYTRRHVVAASTSGYAYLFSVAPPAPGDGGVVKRMTMVRCVWAMGPAPNRAPSTASDTLALVRTAVESLGMLDTIGFAAELHAVAAALGDGGGRVGKGKGQGDSRARDKKKGVAHTPLLLPEELTRLEAEAERSVCPRTGLVQAPLHPFLKEFARAVDAAEDLVAVAEELWADAAAEAVAAAAAAARGGTAPPASPAAARFSAGAPSLASLSQRVLDSCGGGGGGGGDGEKGAAKNKKTTQQGGGVSLLTADAFSHARLSWAEELLPARAARDNLREHHRVLARHLRPDAAAAAAAASGPEGDGVWGLDDGGGGGGGGGGTRGGKGRGKAASATVVPEGFAGVTSLTVFDERWLVTGAKNGVVQLYDLGGKEEEVLEGVEGVEAGAAQATLKPVWTTNVNDADAGTAAAAAPYNAVRRVSVNGSRTQLMVGAMSGVAILAFEAKSGGVRGVPRPEVDCHHGDLTAHLRRLRPRPEGYGELWGLSAHPLKPQVATCTEDGTVRVWDLRLRMEVKRRGLAPHQPHRCAYSGDGVWMAVGFRSGCFGVYKAASMGRLWPALGGSLLESRFRAGPVEAIAFSPDKGYLAVAVFTFLDIYKLSSGGGGGGDGDGDGGGDGVTVEYYGTCHGVSSPLKHLDWSDNSMFLQCASKSYELLLYDLGRRAQGGKIMQLTRGRSAADITWATQSCPLGWPVQGIFSKFMDGTDVNACARSGDRVGLAVGTDRHTLELYNYPCVGSGFDRSGRMKYRPQKRRYYGHAAHVTGVCWSCDDAFVCSVGGNDLTVMQWVVSAEEGDNDNGGGGGGGGKGGGDEGGGGGQDAGTRASKPAAASSGAHPSAPKPRNPPSQPQPQRQPPPPPASEKPASASAAAASPASPPPPQPPQAKTAATTKAVHRPHSYAWVQRHKGPVTRATLATRLSRQRRSKQQTAFLRARRGAGGGRGAAAAAAAAATAFDGAATWPPPAAKGGGGGAGSSGATAGAPPPLSRTQPERRTAEPPQQQQQQRSASPAPPPPPPPPPPSQEKATPAAPLHVRYPAGCTVEVAAASGGAGRTRDALPKGSRGVVVGHEEDGATGRPAALLVESAPATPAAAAAAAAAAAGKKGLAAPPPRRVAARDASVVAAAAAAVGEEVGLRGLKRFPAFNGRVGKVVGYAWDAGAGAGGEAAVVVVLADGQKLQAKARNVRAVVVEDEGG